MKLYGSYTSPFVRHCRIVLLETNIDCEFVETDGVASAAKSPTKKVPFFEDGDIFLTDSLAIVKYLRDKAGQPFLRNAQELDKLCLINTLMDASVFLFLMEKDGVTPEQSAYLKRSAARVESGVAELEKSALNVNGPYTDVELRLGCFLAWAKFRQRFTFDQYPKLAQLVAQLENYAPFAATPPRLPQQ